MSMTEQTVPAAEPAGNTAICTIFEKDYHLGLAALVNSLARAGFAGKVWAGYRGPLPPWTRQLNQLKRLDGEGEYQVGDRIRLAFVPLTWDRHLSNCKPTFMLDLLENRSKESEYLWYFDPDVFIRCNWQTFADWQRCGIAMCQDRVSTNLPADAPLRHKWMEIGRNMGLGEPRRALYQYFNSGAVGVAASQTSFLRLWQRILDQAAAMGVNVNRLMAGSRAMPFHAVDQDGMNMAAMYTEHSLSTMGQEAMGFIPGGFTMYHVPGPKPWRGSMLRRALAGYPPHAAAKFYFTQATSPIRIYSPGQLRIKRLDCALAAFIGRFYHRQT
jgi:hypothetical protein